MITSSDTDGAVMERWDTCAVEAPVALLDPRLEEAPAGDEHSRSVGFYAALTARALGLSPRGVKRVALAGILHDIGKTEIPTAILEKPAALTPAERAQIQRHPEIGAGMLGDRRFSDIRSWVLSHHERPDGRGYPEGLSGDEIPIEARILAVVDAYDAMTSDRVYRRSIGHRAACTELRRGAGTQFDPTVVAAFLRVLAGRQLLAAA